jgi:hypothetical protein
MMPAAITLATALPPRDDVVERGHDHLGLGRLRHQLDRDFGDDAQHAFRADEHGQQVQARRIERLAAQFDDVALDGADAHAQHVVHRQAVFEAVHAAGILGDVAADGAGDLGGRVGRVVQAEGRGRFRNRQIAHARLDHRRARIRSTRTMRFRRAVDITTPSASGWAPPDRPVPAPRGTIGTISSRHTCRIASTCSSLSGSVTIIGSWR